MTQTPEESAATAPKPNLPPAAAPAAETAEQLAADLAVRFEGFSAVPYPDPGTGGDPWAQGYGSTHDDKGRPITRDSPPISEATARQWMVEDMQLAMVDIREAVKVPLTAQEQAACEDFIYNCGAGNFSGSTLCRLINLGDIAGAAAQFELWDHADGKVMAGLLRRRLAEEALFTAGPEA